ncbi:uncharacterized protein LOC135384956 [Ornithodoros turicata]|uniref:uncharacterized protein LOC135384956 n=1 Tax=Ornithodoros turicata TaxID=34597 RepID=UPI0031390B71
MCRFLGSQHPQTTAYHPCANGLVERLHRTLKTALRAHDDPSHRVERLPLILLGVRAAVKTDAPVSPAELVHGAPLRLPGEFFDHATLAQPSPDLLDYATCLQSYCADLRPLPTRSSSSRSVFIHPALHSATHVFLRHDAVRKPLQPPYDGAFPVHSRQAKTITIRLPHRLEVVSVDRVKPAFLPAVTPVPELSRASSPCPHAPVHPPRSVHWAPGPPSVRLIPLRLTVQGGGVPVADDDARPRPS